MKKRQSSDGKIYYEVIYSILTNSPDHERTAMTLKHLKTKITRLNNVERQSICLDNDERDRIEGEEPSLYHLIRAKKRCTQYKTVPV